LVTEKKKKKKLKFWDFMLSVGLIKRPNSAEPNSSSGLSELSSTQFYIISQQANGEYVYEFYTYPKKKKSI
jgi:hypothetical protein